MRVTIAHNWRFGGNAGLAEWPQGDFGDGSTAFVVDCDQTNISGFPTLQLRE